LFWNPKACTDTCNDQYQHTREKSSYYLHLFLFLIRQCKTSIRFSTEQKTESPLYELPVFLYGLSDSRITSPRLTSKKDNRFDTLFFSKTIVLVLCRPMKANHLPSLALSVDYKYIT